jgi:hypothetical protein
MIIANGVLFIKCIYVLRLTHNTYIRIYEIYINIKNYEPRQKSNPNKRKNRQGSI